MGILVVFEGIDRAGKSTQVKKLIECLKKEGKKVDTIVFPSQTVTGKLLRQILSGKESVNPQAMHLLFSADRYQMKPILEQKIAENDIVILDRYYYSGLAYSVAKGLDPNWCKKIDDDLPKPDHIIYLDINPQTAAKRSDYGDSIFDTVEFQTKVRTQYWQMINPKWKKINTSSSSIDHIHDHIVAFIRSCLT